MQPSGMIEHDEPGTDQTGRASRWSRVRPGRSLMLFPATVAAGCALLIGVVGLASQLFGSEEDRGTWAHVVGAVVGNFVMAFVLALVVSTIVRVAGVRQTNATPHPVDLSPPPPPGASQHAPTMQSPHRQMMRRVAVGGVLGGLPGLLMAVVPLCCTNLGSCPAISPRSASSAFRCSSLERLSGSSPPVPTAVAALSLIHI